MNKKSWKVYLVVGLIYMPNLGMGNPPPLPNEIDRISEAGPPDKLPIHPDDEKQRQLEAAIEAKKKLVTEKSDPIPWGLPPRPTCNGVVIGGKVTSWEEFCADPRNVETPAYAQYCEAGVPLDGAIAQLCEE